MNYFSDKESGYLSDEVRQYFMGIFNRQYYTESGPLVQELEKTLQKKLKIRNVVCVSNASIAWLMLLDQLFSKSFFFTPQNTSKQLKEAISWLGFPSIEYNKIKKIIPVINKVRKNGKVIFVRNNIDFQDSDGIHNEIAIDSNDTLIDTQFSDELLGANTRDIELSSCGVLSFDSFATDFGFGACIYTDDDDFSDVLRCMRSSGGIRRKVPVKRTVNGRMSEAQAAFVLLGLKKMFDSHHASNS